MSVAMIGRAWRTPLGSSIDAAMARLHAGERAATTDPRAGYACSVIAPILVEPARSRQSRFLRRMGLFGLEVAAEALAESGVGSGSRIGLFSGVGGLRAHWDDMIAAFANQREDGERMWERGLAGVHPYWMLRHLSNNVHALASAELDLRGEGATFGGGNGGAQAIAAASRALLDGAIDAALVVAYDSLLEPETLVELGARGSATTASLDALVAPYAARATGFVPGEAAAAIVLVREATVVGRETSARLGPTRIAVREGAGADALARCAVLARDAGIIDGAAQAWPDHDRAERALLGDLCGGVLTALTAAMGQLGAATSLVQAIALAEMIRASTASPIAGLVDADGDGIAAVTQATKTTARVGVGMHLSAPELASAIRVEVIA